jgi:hypothetical protein
MPYTKQELITLYSLQEDEVNQTLAAAELSVEGEPYTDEQIQTGFDTIRNYFNSKQVSDYAAAAELFKQHQAQQQLETDVQAKNKKSTKGKKPENPNENGVAESEQLTVVELLARASQQVGTRISLTEAVHIFNACGLPDKEQYSYLECDRFLEACALKQEGKTYKEIATYFGIQQMETNDSQMIGAALDIDTAAAKLVNDLAHSKAAEAASLVVPAFKYHFAREISSSKIRQEFEAFGHQLHAELGKGETRMMRVMMEINSAPSLQQKQVALPEASNNGLTSE